MPTTSDNTATANLAAANTTVSVTFTVSASATAIWAGLETDVATSGVTCVLNPSGVNQSFTAIGSAIVPTGGQHVYAFGLVNPAATGSVTIKFSWTTSSIGVCGAQSYLGTATTSVANTFYNNNTATGSTGTTASVAITSQTGDLVVGIMASDNTVSAVSGTTIWLDNTVSDDAAHYASGAATVTLSTTIVSGFDWAHQGCSVRQASAAGLPPGQQNFETPRDGGDNRSFPFQLRAYQWPKQNQLLGKDQFNPGKQLYDRQVDPQDSFAQWRAWRDSYKLTLIGKDKFNPGAQLYDLPAAQVPDTFARWRSWAWSYNLNLIGQDLLPTGKQSYDLTPAGPFGQDVFAKWRSWSWSYNLNLIGKDQFPAGKQWNELPRGVTWLPDSPPQNLANTLLKPLVAALPPGVQFWELSPRSLDSFANWRAFANWYNLNLINLDRTAPGKQFNYLPSGPTWQPESPQSNILANLLSTVPIVPVGAQSYDLPPRVGDSFAQWRAWQWQYRPLLINQDAFPIGAIWDERPRFFFLM